MTRARRHFIFTSAQAYPLSGAQLWSSATLTSRFVGEALGLDPSDLRAAAAAPYPVTLSSVTASPQPPAPAAAIAMHPPKSSPGTFALNATDTAMQREKGVGPLDFERFQTHAICPLRYCFRYVHNIAGAALQSDLLLEKLMQQSVEDLLRAAHSGQNSEPPPPGATKEYFVSGTKDLIAVDVIENAFLRRLQQVSAPLGQSALPQPLIMCVEEDGEVLRIVPLTNLQLLSQTRIRYTPQICKS